MSIGIQHNVPVVPILDLQQEPDNTVRGHGYDKVSSCSLEFLRTFISVLLQEVLVHPNIGLSSELISGLGVRNTFYNTALKFPK